MADVSVLGVLFLGLGLAVFAVVAMQATLALAAAFRQFRSEGEQRELAVDLLKRKLEGMKALHKEIKEKKENTWSGTRKFRVDKRVPEGGGITSIYLKPHDGKKIPPFKPGQYLTFQLKIPGQAKDTIRCYSLSDGVSDQYYRVSVKKVLPPRDKPDVPPGLSSTFFNDVLEEGDILDCKPPGGAFFLETREQFPIVLIGGGIGITPVYSMLKTLVDEHSDREIWFFYGVRNGKEAVYKKELKEIEKTCANVRMNICYSSPGDGDKEGEDYHHAERVTVDLFKRVLPSNNFEFYICGPPPMMQTLVPDLETWGVPVPKIKYEAFGPATVKKKKPKTEEAPKSDAAPGFKVKFASSGKEVEWKAGTESLLELGEDNDVAMSSGCRIGNCGTCMIAVKSGEFEYANEPSFEADAGTCLACCAVPKGPMEIDA